MKRLKTSAKDCRNHTKLSSTSLITGLRKHRQREAGLSMQGFNMKVGLR